MIFHCYIKIVLDAYPHAMSLTFSEFIVGGVSTELFIVVLVFSKDYNDSGLNELMVPSGYGINNGIFGTDNFLTSRTSPDCSLEANSFCLSFLINP